ncbi:PIG-L deacetylase family protein [Tessaracoccus massiliensis]|uniref:PIG-L deacetylase family protein n=1 Tax=Tessaracoccus massiliensis TaxID=1522311 RepID=UPI0009442514|nr:PIG-L family deacetylase [Tessaracoccus massiliensis]
MTELFPENWNHALVVVAHPDDPEYGMAAAVAKWTRVGKKVTYILATSGEAGIEGMDPAKAGPLREEEQRRAGIQVGVDQLVWLGLPDGKLSETTNLAEAIRAAIDAHPAEVVITTYMGPECAPDLPNQPDHIAVGEATLEALKGRSLWHFENGPEPTHHVLVEDGDVQAAVRSFAEHDVYLAVLDPETPVKAQARAQVYSSIERSDREIRVNFRLLGRPSPALRANAQTLSANAEFAASELVFGACDVSQAPRISSGAENWTLARRPDRWRGGTDDGALAR